MECHSINISGTSGEHAGHFASALDALVTVSNTYFGHFSPFSPSIPSRARPFPLFLYATQYSKMFLSGMLNSPPPPLRMQWTNLKIGHFQYLGTEQKKYGMCLTLCAKFLFAKKKFFIISLGSTISFGRPKFLNFDSCFEEEAIRSRTRLGVVVKKIN